MRNKNRSSSDVDNFKDVLGVLTKEFQSTLLKFVEVINASVAAAAAAEEKKTQKSFYPENYTAFFKPGMGTQDKLLLAVSTEGQVKPGSISFVDMSGDECFWDDWLGSVRSGLIEIVYCPRMGRVASNGDYLKYWGLSP